MLLYIKRMETEKEDLQAKIKKAFAVLNSDIELGEAQTMLLEEQTGYMKKYLEVLENRIALEKKLHSWEC